MVWLANLILPGYVHLNNTSTYSVGIKVQWNLLIKATQGADENGRYVQVAAILKLIIR